MIFDDFFKKATGVREGPYPFQRKFAENQKLYQLVDVPTGLGKTAMAILGWLWRRFHADEVTRKATPRRLVYCLPMRVLVEQTAENARKWVETLRHSGGVPDNAPIHVLMGGEEKTDWAMWPEREAILIGTQDMLLSRALNRGYAASRARWPMEFGLLHNDSLWVFDEIQLMGPGLATTAQLEAFRRLLGSQNDHGCGSVWMSATLQRDWLMTVDFDLSWLGETLRLTEDDFQDERVTALREARKPLQPAKRGINDLTGLAAEILEDHKLGTRTIVVVNTVRRVCDLYDQIAKKWGSASGQRLVLLHSRFRPDDRKAQIDKALADPPPEGTIIVSTQVIEAGVDVNATTLFTELAPWASLVQRFGRCNRKGKESNDAVVYWIDVADKDAAPYEAEDLNNAREQLGVLTDVGLRSLNAHPVELPFEHTHVIRRKDLIDLFDTTPDLAGNDIDIDRFVREVEDSDVRVFWRAWDRPKGQEPPPNDEPAPRHKELCPAPIGEFRDFAKKHSNQVWRWNFLDRMWETADAAKIVPGQVFLVHADAGGYSADRGWTPTSTNRVELVGLPGAPRGEPLDATDDDRLSCIKWQTLAEHGADVQQELDAILQELAFDSRQIAEALRLAARCHDWGKAHEVFQRALPDGAAASQTIWAKAAGKWKPYERPHFRHELASALAVLLAPENLIPADQRNLVAYLVATHHGKVRLSIRSLPNEKWPDPAMEGSGRQCRFARGVWDGDELPATELGGGVTAPAVTLSLEPMELGLCEEEPFKDQPSWAERMIRLRDSLGPFRLAYLEALLRAADWRASQPENHP